MRQVKSQALRTGVNQDWGVTAAAVPNLERAARHHVKQTLKQVSAYPVVVASATSEGVLAMSVVFYKYIQRARYRRSVLHRVRTERLESRRPAEKAARSQRYTLPFSTAAALERQIARMTGQETALSVQNVFAVFGDASRLDLLTIQRHYMFQRYKNLMYLADLLQMVQISSRVGSGGLFTDCFSKGLIRNRRKGQRRFLRLVQAAVQYFRNNPANGFRPDGWRVELYGKVDGELRAKRHLLKFGNVSVQSSVDPLNYTQRTVGTKVGTFGLKVWMHLPARTDGWLATPARQPQLTPSSGKRKRTRTAGPFRINEGPRAPRNRKH